MNKIAFEHYLQSKGKKQVIFDFDETITTLLIDWSYWHENVCKLFTEYDKDLVKYEEKKFNTLQNEYIARYGTKLKDELININYEVEKNYFSGHVPSSLALSLLSLTKKYADIYMWTSNDRRTVTPIIKELAIENFFSKIISRNDVNFVKPDPYGFYLIYDDQNPKSDYLLIGDSDADRMAAQNADIDFINIQEITES